MHVNLVVDNQSKVSLKSLRFGMYSVSKKKKRTHIGNPQYMEKKAFPMTGPAYWQKAISYTIPSKVKPGKTELVIEIAIKHHSNVRVRLELAIGKSN